MIAMLTVTMNDGYKLKEWHDHYLKYKDDIYLHIIIDNGSTKEYLDKVKELFSDSVIIELNKNGGSTAAYNAGIKYALNDKKVKYIALIGNDIMLDKGSFNTLIDILERDPNNGMIAPILLNNFKDGGIDCYGESIDRKNMNLIVLNKKADIKGLPEVIESDTLPGGCNVAKREFYEKVGLQDEKFFMYADEVDMGIRAERVGFKMLSTKLVKSWHMHINPPGMVNRNPMAAYLMGRNHIYLAKKLFGKKEVFYTVIHRTKSALIFYLSAIKHRKSKEEYRYAWYFLKGIVAGIQGNMKNNF